MQTAELVDLAAFVAANGQALIAGSRTVPTTALADYWTASKCRHDRWNRWLREHFRTAPSTKQIGVKVESTAIHAVCEEILISEMLTRVWSSIITSLDSATGASEAQPVAASVMAGQLDASNRVLEFIALERKNSNGADSDLNRLRRLTQRWTDLLLGGLLGVCEISPFVHDATRAQEFADDFGRSREAAIRQQAWALLTMSLRTAFHSCLCDETPNADLNARIAGSIVACFPSDLFDSTGVFHSLWMLRLSATTADTQLLVDELLAADATSKNEIAPPSSNRFDRSE